MAAKEKKGLGTGLGVLFGADEFDDEAEQLTLPISKVEPRSEQPREYFDQEALEALAEFSGKRVRDDLVATIFSRFCVGK